MFEDPIMRRVVREAGAKATVETALRKLELIFNPGCLQFGPLQGLLLGFVVYWSTGDRARYFKTVEEELADHHGRKRKCRASADFVQRDLTHHEGSDLRDDLRPGFIQTGNPADAGWSGTCQDIVKRFKFHGISPAVVARALRCLTAAGVIKHALLPADNTIPHQHLHLALKRDGLFAGACPLGDRILFPNRDAPRMLRYSPNLSTLPLRRNMFLTWLVYRCAGEEKRSRRLPRDPEGRPMWYCSKNMMARLLCCTPRAALAIASELVLEGLVVRRALPVNGGPEVMAHYAPVYGEIQERLEPDSLTPGDEPEIKRRVVLEFSGAEAFARLLRNTAKK